MATDLPAVESSRHLVAVEAEGASSLQELRQHYPRFQAGERCADTVVDTTAERYVVARRRTVEPYLVGLVELLRIAIAGAPKQQNGGSRGDIRVSSFDPGENEGHVGDNVGQSRNVDARRKRGSGAVESLAIISGLP